jgi:Rieske Fe-S protein
MTEDTAKNNITGDSIIRTGMHRREFVKLSTGCALLLAVGGLGTLQGCTAAKIYNTTVTENQCRIPLSEFLTDKMRTLRIPKWKYDILVVKKGEKDFNAILLECTHRRYELNVNAKGINCPAHGSAFNFEGKVLVGPATEPLKKFDTYIDGKDLVVKV